MQIRSAFRMFFVRWVLFATGLMSGLPAAAQCLAVKHRDSLVCLGTFTCVELPQSGAMSEACYDGDKSYMLIKLSDGWHQYCGVDRTSADNLIHSPSIETYYNQSFRSRGPLPGSFSCKIHLAPAYRQCGC